MNQTIFLLLGVLGIAGIGSLVSGNDDAHPPEGDGDDPRLNPDTVIEGDDEDNVLNGTAGDDGILAKGGDDLINPGAGDDLVGAGFGDDTVTAAAGDGDDEIYLGAGDDLYGGLDLGADEGNDTIFGGSGEDTIITNLGNHYIEAGDGDDRIEDHGGTVYIDGGDDDDLILSPDASTPDAQDTLMGGSGDDTIHAGAYDLVDAGDGADLIVLRSDAGGPTDIAYDASDRLNITLADGYDGPEEVDLVQDQGDVHVVLNGQVMAILRDTEVAGVGSINVIREAMGR